MRPGLNGCCCLSVADISQRYERRPEMTTAATEETVSSTKDGILHLAFELGRKKWKLGFTIGLGQKARKKNVAGGNTAAVLNEIAAAQRRFGLPEDARVVSWYEAG